VAVIPTEGTKREIQQLLGETRTQIGKPNKQPSGGDQPQLFFFFFIVLLFICAYNAWVISRPCPHPLPYHPLRPLSLPSTPSITGRNYFALISNFVVERV
jgi:hypothetical protein